MTSDMAEAVTTQPGIQAGYYSPGLQYLAMVDQLLVKQEVTLIEVFLPYESKNRYGVYNSLGQRIFIAAEDSNFCCRQCCGSSRPWTVHVCDNFGQPNIEIERNCNCGAFFPYHPCCSDSIQITAADGTLLGSVERKCNPCCPGYNVLNDNEERVLNIVGPCCLFLLVSQCCCQDQIFEIQNLQDAVIGDIRKQFSGLLKEAFTEAENFSATFPVDLDTKIKAALLGAVFMIDFNFYENEPKKEYA